MQISNASVGTFSDKSKMIARLPSNLNSDRNRDLNVSTRLVWQLKYIAYCNGADFFQAMRIVLPLLLADVR